LHAWYAVLKDIGQVEKQNGAPHVENWQPLPKIIAGHQLFRPSDKELLLTPQHSRKLLHQTEISGSVYALKGLSHTDGFVAKRLS